MSLFLLSSLFLTMASTTNDVSAAATSSKKGSKVEFVEWCKSPSPGPKTGPFLSVNAPDLMNTLPKAVKMLLSKEESDEDLETNPTPSIVSGSNGSSPTVLAPSPTNNATAPSAASTNNPSPSANVVASSGNAGLSSLFLAGSRHFQGHTGGSRFAPEKKETPTKDPCSPNVTPVTPGTELIQGPSNPVAAAPKPRPASNAKVDASPQPRPDIVRAAVMPISKKKPAAAADPPSAADEPPVDTVVCHNASKKRRLKPSAKKERQIQKMKKLADKKDAQDPAPEKNSGKNLFGTWIGKKNGGKKVRGPLRVFGSIEDSVAHGVACYLQQGAGGAKQVDTDAAPGSARIRNQPERFGDYVQEEPKKKKAKQNNPKAAAKKAPEEDKPEAEAKQLAEAKKPKASTKKLPQKVNLVVFNWFEAAATRDLILLNPHLQTHERRIAAAVWMQDLLVQWHAEGTLDAAGLTEEQLQVLEDPTDMVHYYKGGVYSGLSKARSNFMEKIVPTVEGKLHLVAFDPQLGPIVPFLLSHTLILVLCSKHG